MMKFFTAILAGFLVLSLVSIAMSQTCPSYSAGFTGQRYIHGSSDGGIYVNEAPALRAPCNGVVYAWHYCYYNEGSATNLEVAFGAYSFMSFAGGDDGDDEDSDSGGSVRGTYHLRSGSYYLHHLDRRKNTFTCDTITLNRSQHFQIYEGDRVGACLREYSGVEPLEILAEDSSRQYKVVKWGSNSGHCRWRDMATSSLERASHAFVLHLYVDININECDLHEDNCSHSLATCIDVIGGDGSFECRCNEGYTGDGVTCTAIESCTCAEHAECKGNDQCVCHDGYVGNGVDSCTNINECSNNPCASTAICIDTDGSYTCVCHSGFVGDGFKNCTNVNECQTNIAFCAENADCADTEGSYTCACSTGFMGDGFISCTDIDECKDDVCDENAQCINTEGSYRCMCIQGYTGDGINCEVVSKTGAIDQSNHSHRSNNNLMVAAATIGTLGLMLFISIGVVLCLVRMKMNRIRRRNIRNVCTKTTVAYVPKNTKNIQFNDTVSLSGSDSYPNQRYSSRNIISAAPSLDFYTTSEYSEVTFMSDRQYSSIMRKVRDGIVENESPYYSPATQEYELYSQLKRENIKAIPKHEIELTDRIGSGEFGHVARGYWKSKSYAMEVAIKTLSGQKNQVNRVKLLQEAAIVSQFKHPNVVKLYGLVNDDDQLMLIFELLSKGDLRHFLFTLKPDPGELMYPQTPKMLLSFSQQIVVGLHYLSRKNFVHRDLAARNVLISENNVCKISDFGMSRDLMEENYYVSHGGKIPVKWTAPEALTYHKYSTASDVWSYGCVLYEIWSLGHKPYRSLSNHEVITEVYSGYRLPPPPGCPRVIYDLMICCWHPEPASRPSPQALLTVLMDHEDAVLRIPKADATTHDLAAVLGAPLKAGQRMYSDLQELYTSTAV